MFTGIQVQVLRKAARLNLRQAAKIYGASMAEWKAWEADEEPIPSDVFQMLEEAAGGIDPLALDFDDVSQ